jgi:Tfp pilus assembly protein PilO
MNENNLDPNNAPHESQPEKTEIFVNDYGTTIDSTVLVEEEDRTVLLTDKETIVIEKEPAINIVPRNRPHRIYAGMWGPTEIATAGVGMLAILTVILLFIFLVLPAKKELERSRAERDRLERELTTARDRYGNITSTEEQVARLVSSVNDFETRHLSIASNGRTSLYQRINGLISAYGLVNASGPDYAPLEIADGSSNQSSEEESGRAKFQSIFPGIYVTMTVEGSYQNLRQFIRQIETSEQFVVISAVELEPSDNKTEEQTQPNIDSVRIAPVVQNDPTGIPMTPGQNMMQPQTKPQTIRPRGTTHGETVSLRLEMAAYFRRPNFVPLPVETVNP